MDSPRVSVILAVRNGMPFLPQAVESVLNGLWKDFELLVVDDASTDETGRYLHSLKDPRVRVLLQAQNQGLARSLNHALDAAAGEYIARIDADDVWFSDRLMRGMAYLETHPETVLLGGSHIEFFGLHLPTEPHLFSLLAVEKAREVSFQALLERNRFCHSSVLFSRQALEKGFRYREVFLHSQDYDLWLRIALEGGVGKLETPVCFY
ncbi:MAG: glycosyltransferase family 2 protein, partial [Planctomycetota bacterium]